MTDPSQYFKGRTVQEQMNEVIGYVDVRSAEVATDAIASDVAQVHSDAADAHADALAAAASAAAAAGTLTNAVKKTGEASQSIDGDIDLNDDLNVDGDATVGGALSVTGAVTVPTPVNNTDAATKKYVDDADALKLNITDVNSYAVGLTGNQRVAGTKDMLNPRYGGWVTDTGTLPGVTDEFVRIAKSNNYGQADYIIRATTANNNLGYAHIIMGGSDQYDRSYKIDGYGVLSAAVFLRIGVVGSNELWIKKAANIDKLTVINVFSTVNVNENVFAATGLSAAPNIGDTNPLTSTAITGVTTL